MQRLVAYAVLRTVIPATGLVQMSACGRFAFEPTAGDARYDEPAPCDPTAPFGTPTAITELNTGANEGSLRLLPDGLSGYFHSNLDILRVVRPDLASPFAIFPENVLSSAGYEQEPTVTPDDLMIVFRRRVAGNDELFYSTRSSPTVPFDTPTPIASLAHAAVDSQPFLSPGDGQLYFQSMRDGADQDIYRSAYDGTAFAVPVLMDELRANNEGDPVVSYDGLTLYWRTSRAGGPGLFDIWSASRASLGVPFSALAPVANVNTSADDGPSWLSPDGCHLYLASNRGGDYDMFVASRP